MLVHAWCEYDFSGSLGGNNDEEIFNMDENLTGQEIETFIKQYIKTNSGIEEADMENTYGWEYFEPVNI